MARRGCRQWRSRVTTSNLRTTNPGTCHGRSMKAPVTWRGRSQARAKAAARDGRARKLKCCSPISNAFLSSIDFGLRGRKAHAMSSFSQQPPKTSESWQSCTNAKPASSLRPSAARYRRSSNGRVHSSPITSRLLQQNRLMTSVSAVRRNVYGVEVIAEVGSIEAPWLLQQPCGSLVMFAAMRRASSRVSRLAAVLCCRLNAEALSPPR